MKKHLLISEDTRLEVDNILRSGELSGFRGCPEGHSGGYWVQTLEEAFREYFNIKHAIAMNSATACLHSACVALNCHSYNVTPYSFVSSASCTLMVGIYPQFIDVTEDTFCMQPCGGECAIPVHLMGHPADLDRFNAQFLIEDAAQAIGAKYKGRFVGTIGDCGVFSFNQSKQISCGEGGMLITNDDYIARVARAMRNHGEVSDPELEIVGYNYRMLEESAKIVLDQFKYLEDDIAYRNYLADSMTHKLKEIDGFTPPVIKDGCRHALYTYAVKFDKKILGMHRDEFQDEMLKRGIYFGKGYVKPLHLLPIFGGEEGQMPVVERMWKEELCVFDWLSYPCMTTDIDKAVSTLKDVLHNSTKQGVGFATL